MAIVAAHVAEAQVVGQDDNDVRLSVFLFPDGDFGLFLFLNASFGSTIFESDLAPSGPVGFFGVRISVTGVPIGGIRPVKARNARSALSLLLLMGRSSIALGKLETQMKSPLSASYMRFPVASLTQKPLPAKTHECCIALPVLMLRIQSCARAVWILPLSSFQRTATSISVPLAGTYCGVNRTVWPALAPAANNAAWTVNALQGTDTTDSCSLVLAVQANISSRASVLADLSQQDDPFAYPIEPDGSHRIEPFQPLRVIDQRGAELEGFFRRFGRSRGLLLLGRTPDGGAQCHRKYESQEG